ncbi:hypothetical protein GCM10008967_17560 [Bacillus carboniphilus]|uniref:Uncharacterized protein n=2 Tax=Bacillus carboniphilus TaxID=86663 RepID=A0ABN0W753_9BACI
MRHDLCYQRGGLRKRCDLEFMDCLRSKIDRRTTKGRQASLMYNVMKIKSVFTPR